MIDLSGKIAVVTGAGRGIGRGCALELARAGADLVVNDRPDSADLAETVAAVEQLGRRCRPVEADVFSRSGCQRVVDGALTAFGRVDALISNPARSVRAAFLEYSPEEFERTVAATLGGGFHLAQLAARHMIQRGGGGRIVFVSSVQAEMPLARSVAYNAAKAGLNHMARTIAAELAEHRVAVNVIEPGWIDTPGERVTFSEETLRREGEQLPWGRLGNPADIGRAAAFLASDASDYITGVVLPVDGCFRFKDAVPRRSIPTRS